MSNIGLAIHLSAPPHGPSLEAWPALLPGIRRAGFQFVSWERPVACHASASASAMLAQAGLKAIGGCDTLTHFEEDTGAALDFWAAMGAPDIALRCFDAAAPGEWATQSRLLAALARRFSAYEFRLAVETALPETVEILRTALGVDALCVHLDTAQLEAAGMAAADVIRAFPGRCPILRVSETGTARPNTPLGQGGLDWPPVFDAAEEAAVEWYSCSIDLNAADALEAAALSYAFLAEHA